MIANSTLHESSGKRRKIENIPMKKKEKIEFIQKVTGFYINMGDIESTPKCWMKEFRTFINEYYEEETIM